MLTVIIGLSNTRRFSRRTHTEEKEVLESKTAIKESDLEKSNNENRLYDKESTLKEKMLQKLNFIKLHTRKYANKISGFLASLKYPSDLNESMDVDNSVKIKAFRQTLENEEEKKHFVEKLEKKFEIFFRLRRLLVKVYKYCANIDESRTAREINSDLKDKNVQGYLKIHASREMDLLLNEASKISKAQSLSLEDSE